MPSFDSFLLEQDLSPEEEHVAKWSATTLYGGGGDTVRGFSLGLTCLR